MRHSFPTRRSSDLLRTVRGGSKRCSELGTNAAKPPSVPITKWHASAISDLSRERSITTVTVLRRNRHRAPHKCTGTHLPPAHPAQEAPCRPARPLPMLPFRVRPVILRTWKICIRTISSGKRSALACKRGQLPEPFDLSAFGASVAISLFI